MADKICGNCREPVEGNHVKIDAIDTETLEPVSLVICKASLYKDY